MNFLDSKIIGMLCASLIQTAMTEVMSQSARPEVRYGKHAWALRANGNCKRGVSAPDKAFEGFMVNRRA
jgi:hypothetical protein